MKRITLRRKDSQLPTFTQAACQSQEVGPLAVNKRSSKIVVPQKNPTAIPGMAAFASFQEGFLESAAKSYTKADKYR
jgi:hypothetical protein